MTILYNIKNQKNFTAGEKQVAEYVFNNIEQVTFSTVTALAENTETSLATVLRLVKKLGYKTFGEFKLALALKLVEIKNNNKIIKNINNDNRVIDEIVYSVNLTKNNMDYDSIKECANNIKTANRIILYGYGVSYAVAYFLYFKLLKLGLNAILIKDTYEADSVVTNNLIENNVAILISGSGSSKYIVDLAKVLKKNKNFVIGLTNMVSSPLNMVCDKSLIGGVADMQLHSGAAYSRIPLIIIAECLINFLMEEEKLSQNLQKVNNKLAQKEY